MKQFLHFFFISLGSYWNHCCSTSLWQRGRSFPHQAQVHIHLCSLWRWPQRPQVFLVFRLHWAWRQWCQRPRREIWGNPRRRGRSEGGRMAKKSVSAAVSVSSTADDGFEMFSWCHFFFFLPHVCSAPKKMSKKRKLVDGSRKLVQPIPLDSSGRPVFPIVLGGLTVYSLGEVSVQECTPLKGKLSPLTWTDFLSVH